MQGGVPVYDPDRLDQRDSRQIERLARLIERVIIPYHRAEVRGLDRIPNGPGIYVGNHSGGLLPVDTFIFAATVFRNRGIKDVPFGLAHDLALELPIFNQILVPLGAVRASADHAQRLLDLGHKILVYPGGDMETFRPFRERNRIKFGNRHGYIRLALRSNMSIVPVVTAGSHGTLFVIDDLPWLARLLGLDKRLRMTRWPLTLSVPWGLTLGPTPPHLPPPVTIRIEILEPVVLSPSGRKRLRTMPTSPPVPSTLRRLCSRLSIDLPIAEPEWTKIGMAPRLLRGRNHPQSLTLSRSFAHQRAPFRGMTTPPLTFPFRQFLHRL